MDASGIPVVVTSKEVVSPKISIEEHRLPLSNLDLIFPFGMNVSVYLCYKRNEHSVSNMASVLTEALAQTLSSFYIFAGEVIKNSRGEPESHCNNRGVDFFHAYADVELMDIDFFHPSSSIQGKFVPLLSQGVFSVQMTELRCGGIVVGCTFDHRVADAYSGNMFLRSWAENARQKPTFYHPHFTRSLLKAHNPTHHCKSMDKWYVIVSPSPTTASYPVYNRLKNEDYDHQYTCRTFYIEAEQVSNLQKLASSDGKHKTKYESFTSFLWQTLACSVRDDSKKFTMSIAIDGRTRLYDYARNYDQSDDKETAKMTRNYFGNVVSFPFTDAKAKDLKKMSLSEVACFLHDFIMETATAGHFYELIDWVELNRPKQPLPRMVDDRIDEDAGILVSSGLRFPALEMNFGWGNTDLGSYYFPWGGEGGYVMPLPSAKGNGDWIVYMHLRNKQMDLIEKEAGHVLKPLLPSYLLQ